MSAEAAAAAAAAAEAPAAATAGEGGATTMRAVVYRTCGPPSVLQLATLPKPVPKPGEVLVKVAYSGVNPIDFKVRRGDMAFAVKLPKIPQGDVSGVVVGTSGGGGGGGKFSVGDRVFGCTGLQEPWRAAGTAAEYVAAREATLLRVPDGVSLAHAAAVPLAALTAFQALRAVPLAGKRVLVHAGAGGVGHFAIQIAKAQGAAFVATTCSARNAEFVRSLGADAAIDYATQRFEDPSSWVVSGGAGSGGSGGGAAVPPPPFDVVVDVMGGDYEARSAKALKRRGGHLAEVLNSGYSDRYGMVLGVAATLLSALRFRAASLLGLGPSHQLVVMKSEASEGLEDLAALMAAGKLRVTVEKVFPLAEAAAAHELLQGGHVRGKVLLEVGGEGVRA